MTQLVGLGGDCQVAYQIERLQPNFQKHFFDSLVTPIESAIELVDNRFDKILQDDRLAFTWQGDTLERITDVEYNIWHLHRLGQGDPADLVRLRAKYGYLAKKFMLLLESGEKVIFVRRWHYIDGTRSEAAARRLLAALQRVNPAAELLFLHDRQTWEHFADGPFRSMYLRPSDTDWRGDNDAWDEILASVVADA
jgi:hypothetical protein